PAEPIERSAVGRRSCNLLGPTALGFRHRDDVLEITRLLGQLGVDVNVTAPLDASPADLARLRDADFNVSLYGEIAEPTARWLQKAHGQPTVAATPIGVGGTREFIRQVAELAATSADVVADVLSNAGRLPWYSRSVDSTYLTGKRVFIFGDATHAIAAARVATEELGFEVVGLGSYSREQARDVRKAAKALGLQAIISDDHLEVEEQMEELRPELVLGTQMERHVAKRLGVPCAVISSPAHVHDYPARYSPQMGFEGANVLFDTWVHPLMMGLEEHLLGMFREDFEFVNGAAPSHLGHAPEAKQARVAEAVEANANDHRSEVRHSSPKPASAKPPSAPLAASIEIQWTHDAQRELKKIPFFVRGKARRNTEAFARERGLSPVTLETLYEAKAHFQGR
ncbi:MAG: ferredoxin:protochlorophyllide reductase (ATP-dependent) subunit B, partial [Myxococcota bacterium]